MVAHAGPNRIAGRPARAARSLGRETLREGALMNTNETSGRLDRRAFLQTVGLSAVATGALSRMEQSLAAAEIAVAATIPDAQLGTLFPFVEQTGARST